jgi:hypothetical protein
MPGGGSKPGERRGGRQRGTPNKTLTEQAQALAAKVAKAEARANAKLVALAHAIQATVAESRGLPGASASERFKELVLNALVAEKLALKEIAHEPENTSIAEPAAEPAAAPDDADGVLVDWVPAALVDRRARQITSCPGTSSRPPPAVGGSHLQNPRNRYQGSFEGFEDFKRGSRRSRATSPSSSGRCHVTFCSSEKYACGVIFRVS